MEFPIINTGPLDIKAAAAVFALDPNWIILRQPTISHGSLTDPPTTVDLALLHAARGIALFDIAPTRTARAVVLLHQTLIAARLPAIYPGPLPIVYRQIAQSELDHPDILTEDVFASERPLFGNLAWVGLATRILGGQRVMAPIPEMMAPQTVRQPRRWLGRVLAGIGVTALFIGGAGATYMAMLQREISRSHDPALVVPEPAPDIPIALPEPTPVPVAPPMPEKPLEPPAVVLEMPKAEPVPVVHPITTAPEVNALISRGNDMLKQHDISAARLYFARAAALGSHLAMTAMGMTFDARTLAPSDARNANTVAAATWYAKARAANGGYAEPNAK